MLLDLLIVALEGLDGVPSVLEPPIEFFLPDKLIDHPAGRLHTLGPRHDQASHIEDRRGGSPRYPVDSVVGALVPSLGVADRKNHLCVGVPLHQLAVERTCWPVHGGPVAAKDSLPVERLPMRGSPPLFHVLRMSEHLSHVVARS